MFFAVGGGEGGRVQRVSGKRTVPVAGSVLLAHGGSHVHMLYLLKGGVAPDQKFIDVRMNAARRKIIVVSGKGGKNTPLRRRAHVPADQRDCLIPKPFNTADGLHHRT